MEVSTIMLSTAQLSQGLNGTAPGDGTGRALFAPSLSERFSHLLDQRAGKGEAAIGLADPSANTMFLNAIMKEQEPGIGFVQSEGKDVLMDPARQANGGEPEIAPQPERDEESDTGFTTDDLTDVSATPALTAFRWNPGFDVNPSTVANASKTVPEISAWQSARNDQAAISAIAGDSSAGLPTEAQFAELSVKNGQQVVPQAADAQAQKQVPESKAQLASLTKQDGNSAVIAGLENSGNGFGEAAIKGEVEIPTGSDAVMPHPDNSEASATMNRPISPLSSPDSPEKPLNTLIRQGDSASITGGEENRLKSENRSAAMTIPQTGEVSQIPAKPVSNITRETGIDVKDAVIAYRASDGKTATPAGSNPGAPAAASQSSDQNAALNKVIGTDILDSTGIMVKQLLKKSGEGRKYDKPVGSSEQIVANLSTKSVLNNAEPAQAQQRIETAFAGVAESSLREAVVDIPGKTGEDKSTNIDSPGITLHGGGEVRMNGENRLPTPANAGKPPFAEQVNHQVREKLESGDFSLNKGNITLKLHPEELGELKINLRMEDQRLKVEIVTENHSVKEALMQNLDSLKETLSRQHITMDRFNVTADLRQGFQQGSRDGSRMMQDSRGTGTQFNAAVAVDEGAVQSMPYSWENDNSLVSLIL